MNLRLREIRKQKKIRPHDIAYTLGITIASYYRYEKEEQRLSADMLAKLAQLFGVSTDYILGLVDDTNEEEEKPIDLKEVLNKELTWGSISLTEEEAEEIKKYAEFVIWKKIKG